MLYMKVGIVQLNSTDNKENNIYKALKGIESASGDGADFVVLPEYVDFMGMDKEKNKKAENIPGKTSELFSKEAKKNNIYLNCGSILEKADDQRVYNTSILFNPKGEIIAKYRKTHLFDVYLKNKIIDKESDTVKPGEEIVAAKTKFGGIGLTICHDLRYPEIFRSLALKEKVKIICVPAAFPFYTGAFHWEILLRARAIENQCYIIAAAQIGKSSPNRECFGNSMIIDPWGTIIAKAKEEETVLVKD